MIPGREPGTWEGVQWALTHTSNTPPSVSPALLAWGVDGTLTASLLTSLSVAAAKTVFSAEKF